MGYLHIHIISLRFSFNIAPYIQLELSAYCFMFFFLYNAGKFNSLPFKFISPHKKILREKILLRNSNPHIAPLSPKKIVHTLQLFSQLLWEVKSFSRHSFRNHWPQNIVILKTDFDVLNKTTEVICIEKLHKTPVK